MKTIGTIVLAALLAIGAALAGLWLGQQFASDPFNMAVGKFAEALSSRDREAAALYHKAQSDLAEKEKRHQAALEESTRRREEAERVAEKARLRISTYRTALEATREVLDAKQAVAKTDLTEKVKDDPVLKAAFADYIEVTEAKISNLEKDRNLVLELLSHEQEINKRLRAQYLDQSNVLKVTRQRFRLAEEEIERLSGKKFRIGPGCTAGAGSSLLPPGKDAGPSVSCGVSVIWG